MFNASSNHLTESGYYRLFKQPIDNFYFVLKETNSTRIILIEKIQKHLIIFQDNQLFLRHPYHQQLDMTDRLLNVLKYSLSHLFLALLITNSLNGFFLF